MANDKMAQAASRFKPQYDSDEDLDEETQRKIRQAGSNSSQANNLRQQAWGKAGAFQKLSKILKGAYYGNKRED